MSSYMIRCFISSLFTKDGVWVLHVKYGCAGCQEDPLTQVFKGSHTERCPDDVLGFLVEAFRHAVALVVLKLHRG